MHGRNLSTKNEYFTLLWKIALIIFLIEGAIMSALTLMPASIPPMAHIFTDVLSLAMLSTPLILIFAVRPYVDRWRQVTSSLQDSESRFKRLYESAPLPYHSLNENTEILEVNTAWLELFGYDHDDVIGKPIKHRHKPFVVVGW